MVTIGDETVAEWEQDEAGEFGGHLKGIAAGATTATFELMHGAIGSASAHADYRSPIRGLYLVGSSAHPGGGVMGASGKLAAETMLKEWK